MYMYVHVYHIACSLSLTLSVFPYLSHSLFVSYSLFPGTIEISVYHKNYFFLFEHILLFENKDFFLRYNPTKEAKLTNS